jgi:TetR/AcrR family transcriptional regulator
MATKPGERRTQILQVLAGMLETPQGEKITTAGLAAKVGVSEAALYRHFASKAQMFEGLIEFIEESIFTLINQIVTAEKDGRTQALSIVAMMLTFAEKNPGMVRVLIGDALVHEDARLQTRINQIIDRIEASIKQSLQLVTAANPQIDLNPGACASTCVAYALGRWHAYAKSGFKRKPSANWAAEQLALRV